MKDDLSPEMREALKKAFPPRAKGGKYPRTCQWCGKEFMAIRPNGTSCNIKCRRKIDAAKLKVKRKVICDVCGNQFNTSHNNKKRCSVKCSILADQKARRDNHEKV